MESHTLFKIPENDVNKVRKEIAVEFLRLAGSGRPKEGLHFFAPECKTHNPYTTGGMKELVDAMIAVQQQAAQGIIKGSTADFKFTIKQVLADGNMVAVYTQVSSSKPSEGGLRQIHLFRFSGDKIAEYWDISQSIPENAPNAAGAFS
jgi:predicted SnoaL-like aldol condensation-catalyzing enzyme